MATVKEMMVESLSKAGKAADQITDNMSRATAFTALAQACAAALSVSKSDGSEVVTSTLVEEAEKPKKAPSKKDTVKQSAPKKKKEEEPVPESATEEEEQTANTTEEPTLTDEWDATAMELLANEMAEFNRYCEMFADDDDVLNDMISDATEGTAKNREDVTPLNIKMVVAYLQAQEAAAEEEE